MTAAVTTPEGRAALWQRLAGLAGSIADPETRAQYQAEWRRQFDAAFPPPPASDAAGHPHQPPRGAAMAAPDEPFQSGSARNDNRRKAAEDRVEREVSDADRVRLTRIAERWLVSRLVNAEPTADAHKAIAWGAGRRVAAGLLDEAEAVAAIWGAVVDAAIPGLSGSDVAKSIDEGFIRGFDVQGQLADLDCSAYPMTDFGIAERFRDRCGRDFKFTTGKGWLGWDSRRWKELAQDKDTPPAELISAVFETIRDVQREARRVRDTGTNWDVVTVLGPRGGEHEVIDDDKPPNPHALDYWIPKGKGFVRYSDVLAGWGRQSETAGKPAAIGALARRWLTVAIEDFDCEQMAVNVLNGTLRFSVETMPDDSRQVAIRLDPHKRDDLITRLAPVEYDRDAPCPLYDGMIAWAHPDDAMRRYVHQIGGYSSTGDTGEHVLWFHYGRGRNGKSVTIDSWCSALGDYSDTIGIESFLDQGIKKRGDQATPDMAKLGGVRLLRASEPERGAKLNAALIKLATGGEPMSVRALHRGFFNLLPRFKLQIAGNSKPSIPDTDDGIWGRMKLVPWLRHIEKPEADPYRDDYPQWHAPGAWPTKDRQLLNKIKAGELAGVFRRLVEGLADYLANGFIEPEAVTQATEAYRNQSDPLARFLTLCTEADAKARVKSSELHEVFAAWCKAAGEKEWSAKGFSDALIDKGFTKVRSDGMRWEGIRLTRTAGDFIDHEGRVRSDLPDLTPPDTPGTAPPVASSSASFRRDDDDVPIG